jgi:ribosomal protein L11 methyltransferase
MSFKQLIINIDSESAEQLSEIFFDLGAISVSIEDQYEGTELEQAIFNEPGMDVEKLWEHSKVSVLLNEDSQVEDMVTEAQEQLAKKFDWTHEVVDDQDWVRLTQSQFDPIEVTPDLYIVPSWHSIPKPDAVGIVLDGTMYKSGVTSIGSN